MSCGPSEKLKELADQVAAAEKKFDAAVNESPLGKINEIKNDALEDINKVMGKLESVVPSILNKAIEFGDKNLHEDVSDFLKMVLILGMTKDEIKTRLDLIKQKWGHVDLGAIKDFDDLEDALRSGAVTLDSICELIPNLDKTGVGIVVQGTPTSFPDIDPAEILKGEPLPDYKVPDIVIDVKVRAKQQAEEFFNLELPDFGW